MRSKRFKIPNKINNNPAEDRQKKYAKTLGVKLPENATKSDAEAVINIELDDDERASEELINYADEKKILCSRYIGNKQLHNLLFDNLEQEDKTAFFCFCVYKFHVPETNQNLCEHEFENIFKEFAKRYTEDFYFKTSLEEYEGEEIIAFGKSEKILPNGKKKAIYGGSIYTTAYKLAYQYLQENLKLN